MKEKNINKMKNISEVIIIFFCIVIFIFVIIPNLCSCFIGDKNGNNGNENGNNGNEYLELNELSLYLQGVPDKCIVCIKDIMNSSKNNVVKFRSLSEEEKVIFLRNMFNSVNFECSEECNNSIGVY